MQDQWFTFNMFDAQAWYIRDIILDKIKLPRKEIMIKYIEEWQLKEDSLDRNDESSIRFQADYIKYILKLTDLNNFDIENVFLDKLAPVN